jgi:long-chain fatty acid transport protein
MKIITKLITLSFLTSTILHATNGDNLISTGAKARAMGGTGVALSLGSQSGLINPALITSVESNEVSFGLTLFMPKIETSLNGTQLPAQSHTSDADFSVIPQITYAHKLNDNWSIGFGIWGTAGMGTDYSKSTFNPAEGQLGNLAIETSLQLLQVGVPIAYKMAGLRIAVTPIMQYGALNINYKMPTATGIASIGDGEAESDVSFGYHLGFAYNFSEDGLSGLTLGAVYKSAIEMEYGKELSIATTPFNQAPFPDILTSDILEQPAEYALGLAYVAGKHTFAFDYRIIQWSDAKGYAEFGWEDSTVYAFGYAYTEDTWAIRAGYNRADSAVVEVTDPRLNFFNLLGFPANAEEHYTFGGSYEINKEFSLDVAYVYSPESSSTFSVVPLLPGVDSLTTTHTENSLTFELVYKF